MKTFWSSAVLLLFFVGFLGCTKPAPKPNAPIMTQAEINEAHANNFLKAAIDFEEDGKKEVAVDVLNELVEKFPESKAAQTAKDKLAKLNEGE